MTLRETHRTTGNNDQQVKVGDVVLVHDDTRRVNWRLAVGRGASWIFFSCLQLFKHTVLP